MELAHKIHGYNEKIKAIISDPEKSLKHIRWLVLSMFVIDEFDYNFLNVITYDEVIAALIFVMVVVVKWIFSTDLIVAT